MSGRARRRATLAPRLALALVGAVQLEIALWGLISPRSFFTDFPGAGHHWVSALGRYNEHLVRDYAAAELGFAVLLLGGAIWFERHLVLVAGSAFLAATIPHFAYHVTRTGSLSTADTVASLGSFVLEVALVGAAMVFALRAPNARQTDPLEHRSGAR